MSDFIGDIVADSAATTPDVVDETSPPDNDAGGNKKGNGKSKGNNKQQKDQVPIEELYDLSKPIKRVSLIVFFIANIENFQFRAVALTINPDTLRLL